MNSALTNDLTFSVVVAAMLRALLRAGAVAPGAKAAAEPARRAAMASFMVQGVDKVKLCEGRGRVLHPPSPRSWWLCSLELRQCECVVA